MNKFVIAAVVGAAFAGGTALAQNATDAPPAQPPVRMHHARTAAPMTRAEVQAHVQAMFARLDADHDGFLTRDEVEAGKAQHGGMKKERGTQPTASPAGGRVGLFDRLDANHDGMISREEFAGAGHGHGAGMHRAGMGGLGGRMFDRADLNKDGRVSLAEAQQAALSHFDAMDLNHDGTVTPEERQQAHQLRKQHKRA